MSLSQSFQQKMSLKLTPQQVQLMKILQIPTVSIEEYINQELEENPALELGESEEEKEEEEIKDEFNEQEEEFEKESVDDDYDDLNLDQYISDSDDEIPAYKMQDENYPEIDDKQVIPIRTEDSFYDSLIIQLGMLELDEKSYKIAEQIVGSMDDDGYLRRELISIADDLAFRQNIETDEKEIEEILKQIQQFDPPGICARDLQECLILQLKRRKPEEGEDIKLAITILKNYFDEFSRKHYEKIQRSLSIRSEQLRDVINLIIKLNPKPGNLLSSSRSINYIIPDFYVYNVNGGVELSLNRMNAPELRLSEGYKDMLREYKAGNKKDKQKKEAVTFIKQKIDSARWFIDLIKQRQITLLTTMQAIIDYQKAFFLTGDEQEIKPMILKNIAEKTHFDISTISRVANSKYVQTEYGTFPLKYFFSEKTITTDGEEVSNKELRTVMFEIIAQEDKHNPLSDDAIMEEAMKRGFKMARRTVAKYREILNIPVARLRKEL